MKTLLTVQHDTSKQVAKVGISMLRPGPLALYRCRLYIKDTIYPSGKEYWKAFPKADATALTPNEAVETASKVLYELETGKKLA